MANHQLLIAGHPSPNTLEFQGNPGFPESSVLPRVVYLCRSQNKQSIALVHRCDPGYGRKGRLPAHGIFHSDLAIYVKLPQATRLAASNEEEKLPAKGQIGSLVEGPEGRRIKGQKSEGDTKGGGWEVGVSLKWPPKVATRSVLARGVTRGLAQSQRKGTYVDESPCREINIA